MLLEVCIDSVESAIAAERGGAQRVELCVDLLEGGITPSAGLIASVRSHISIDLFVMIRPRGGDFCYSDFEFEGMREEIRHARNLGADGLVLGLLDPDASIDIARTRGLVELARPLPVTFHRAIDMTPDLPAAVEHVIQTGATRILTSGGANNALRGMREIANMIERARGRISIMPGGGVTVETIPEIARTTGANEFHSSVRSTMPSPVGFRKQGIAMGSLPGNEFVRYEVREENVRALVTCLERLQAE
jgi:copper homeostasis protein